MKRKLLTESQSGYIHKLPATRLERLQLGIQTGTWPSPQERQRELERLENEAIVEASLRRKEAA